MTDEDKNNNNATNGTKSDEDGNIDDVLSTLKSDAAPHDPDENTRKRALNSALSEYDSHVREKNQKKSQGSSLLSRLMGNSHPTMRRTTMTDKRKKLVIGGMATACVALFALGTVLTGQMESRESTRDQGFSKIAANISSTPKRENASQLNRVEFGKAEETRKREAAPSAKQTTSSHARAPVADMAAGLAQTNITAEETGPKHYKDVGRDKFENVEQNEIKRVAEAPVSTFSADVDTASYSFVRRQINHGVLPQKDAVRVEEMINYFDYDYPLPESEDKPFKPDVAVTPSPWTEGKELIRIGIKGYDITPEEKPKSNLVFLLDVSGSMRAPDKLPLLRQSFRMLVNNLNPDDRVGIVVYAGSSGTVLEPTKAANKSEILNALNRLNAGGSTAGAQGIRQAYALAEQHFDKDAVNRIILATDGDFNVGITDREELKSYIERKRDSGIFLSILGFGQGNLNDHMMQTLAQNGNGIAAYIDTLNEARKVLVEEASSTLFPIARDVKIQVEFNPERVSEYRLIGYETRALKREDFKNDKVDAGDIGAGHTVTAIYEVTPVGSEATSVAPLRYRDDTDRSETANNVPTGNEYAFLKIRYKLPGESQSRLITRPVTTADRVTLTCPPCPEDAACKPCGPEASDDTRFAIAVAAFGQKLKGGKYIGDFSYDDIIDLAQNAKGDDPFGYRAEFIQLVRQAKATPAMKAR